MARKPAQEDEDLLSQADESLQGEPMDITALETDKPSVKPSSSDRTAETIGRMVAGATPTLFGFLFGPQQSERGIAQTKAFGAAGKPSKLVPIIGPEGKPIYETPEGALGQEVYQKPLRGAGAAGLKVEKIKDPTTGKETFARVDLLNKTVEPLTYVEGNIATKPESFKPIETKTYTDEAGNVRTMQTTPYGDVSLGQKTLSSGLGQKYGIRQDEAESGLKQKDNFLKEAKPIADVRNNLSSAMSLLNAGDKESVMQALGIFKTTKIVAAEKLSDSDRAYLNQAPGIIDNLTNKLMTAVSNEQASEIVNQMRQVAVSLDNVQQKALNNLKNDYIASYSSGDMKKAKYLGDMINPVGQTGQYIQSPPVTPSAIPVPMKTFGTGKYTKEQLDAMTPGQRERIKQEILKSRGKK